MFDDLLKKLAALESDVLNEFELDIPTTFVREDFEIVYMKLYMALCNKQIDYGEFVFLCNIRIRILKVWMKLNDVK